MKKDKGKSKTYVINDEVRQHIKSIKEGLQLQSEDGGDALKLYQAFLSLDDYDQNILCAYLYYSTYEKPSVLYKMLCISPGVLTSRINKIQEQLRKYGNH